MSSLVDAVLNSDNLDLDLAAAAGSDGQTPAPRPRPTHRSSSRPRGPPSESNGHLSDVEGFPDDEIVGLRGTDRNRPRNPLDRAVPRVVDQIGEVVQLRFGEFLES